MGSNMGSHMEVAKPAIFSGEAGRVGGFIMACRLYIKMKLRGNTVEEQVQWVLTYVQGGSADVWKENIIDELESEEVEYKSVEEFLICLRKEFGGGEEELESGEVEYVNTHCTCSSTVFPLNFILIYSLHTVINPPTLPISPLKMAGFATSIWDPVLDPVAPVPTPPCAASRA